MQRPDIITGLDIGSAAIRMVVGQRSPEQKLNVIAAAEVPAEGITKGTVVSIEEAVKSINKCLEKTEKIAGVKIESAWVGISGSHIISQDSRGVVAVSRSDGEITEEDVYLEDMYEKTVTVSSDSAYHYTDVRSEAAIPEDLVLEGVEFNLFWMIDSAGMSLLMFLHINCLFDNNSFFIDGCLLGSISLIVNGCLC